MKHYEGMFILHNRDQRGDRKERGRDDKGRSRDKDKEKAKAEDKEKDKPKSEDKAAESGEATPSADKAAPEPEVPEVPDTPEEVIRKLIEKVGGTVAHSMLWANRKLAYPIHGNQTGTYVICYFSGEVGAIDALNREVKLSDRCLRSMAIALGSLPKEDELPEPLAEPASRTGRRFEGDTSAELGKDGEQTRKIWELLDYKNPFVLRRMISAQGKLFSRVRSNLEAKSQRRLRTAVFRARNMALLPFVGR